MLRRRRGAARARPRAARRPRPARPPPRPRRVGRAGRRPGRRAVRRVLAEPRRARPDRGVPRPRRPLARARRPARADRLAAGSRIGRGRPPAAGRRPRRSAVSTTAASSRSSRSTATPTRSRPRSRAAGFDDVAGHDDRPLLRPGDRRAPDGRSGVAASNGVGRAADLGPNRVRYSGRMTPLSERTIATVGSGVMAEAMIAGLLRGELVAPDQIVASHPRAGAARPPPGASTGSGSSATTSRRSTAPTSSCSGSSPRCWPGSAARSGRRCARGQVVLSVLAGATTDGPDRDARPRPGHPGDAEHARPGSARA